MNMPAVASPMAEREYVLEMNFDYNNCINFIVGARKMMLQYGHQL